MLKQKHQALLNFSALSQALGLPGAALHTPSVSPHPPSTKGQLLVSESYPEMGHGSSATSRDVFASFTDNCRPQFSQIFQGLG